MGLTASWIAIKGVDKEDLFDRLSLEEIGETTDEFSKDFAFAETSEGWSILLLGKWPPDINEIVAQAAPCGSALAGLMVENVTYSEVRGYSDGQLSWSVSRYADKGGTIVHGDPPEPFLDIRQRLEAEQAASGRDDVDYLFDLPLDLAESLSGYYPGSAGQNWRVLGRKSQGKAKPDQARSLTAAMRKELLPLLWSLGWTPAEETLDLYEPRQIVRELGTKKQTLWFDYGSGPLEVHISVRFVSETRTASGSIESASGHGGYAPVRLPWWKRFSWSRFWAISQAQSAPEDAVGAAIDKARAEILAIDDYLKTGVAGPRVQVTVRERQPTTDNTAQSL